MKAIPRLFTLAALSLTLPGVETVSLCDVPPTDAALFWTHDGPRAPVMDQNLQGHPITIASNRYERGIAGHTGFSAVYNLSAAATGFTCLAGIEDEDHPKDPKDGSGAEVRVVCLVDRREVFRQSVRLGEAPIPIALPLRGAHQLELRGEYGKTGFLRQRIAFVNPSLEVENRAAFLAAASTWRDRVESQRRLKQELPAVPDWKNLKIEKVSSGAHAGQYLLSTPFHSLRIAPARGGMILAYGPTGGPNLLSNEQALPETVPLRGACPDLGTHFTRYQPRNYFIPPDPILLCGSYRIAFPEEGKIVMSSPDSHYLFLSQRYELEISPQTPVLRVTIVQKNLAPFAQTCGVWAITRVPTRLGRELAMPAEDPKAARKFLFSPETNVDLIQRTGGWDRIDLVAAAARVGKGGIEWQQQPIENELRLKFDGFNFRLRSLLLPGDLADMGDFYPAHYYVSPKFIEMECHGPTRLISPGAEITLTETWEIVPD